MIRIKENFAQYAMHKFSSNVIEKCVERADAEIINQFKMLIFDTENPIMKMLLRSQHSFFIIQKIYNRLD
jgi:Pumilio-family RNA binding repeat